MDREAKALERDGWRQTGLMEGDSEKWAAQI